MNVQLPQRLQDSHKGTFGRVITIASSAKYTGAGYLCAKAASIAGAGYSTIAVPEHLADIYRTMDAEILVLPLKESPKGNLCKKSLDNLDIESYDAIAIGGGIDIQRQTIEFIREFFIEHKDSKKPFIIDADAINCLSKIKGYNLPKNSLLTPHKGEFQRLSKNNLITTCQILKTNILLKSHRSEICDGQKIWTNQTGCSALAKAGSGDVLTGLISGFCAQGLPIFEAAKTGAHIHGLASEIYAIEHNEYSMTMKNLLEYIPRAISKVMK